MKEVGQDEGELEWTVEEFSWTWIDVGMTPKF